MDVASLKAQIRSGNLDKFYIFTGDEWYVQKLYIQQIAKRLNADVNSVDDSRSLFKKLSAPRLFRTVKVYTLRDDEEIIRNPYVIDSLLSVIDNNVVILTLSNVDKRTKLYKTYKNTFIEFHTLERAVLKRHVKAEIALSDRNIDRLIDICECNYGRILLEIDKIKEYVNAE